MSRTPGSSGRIWIDQSTKFDQPLANQIGFLQQHKWTVDQNDQINEELARTFATFADRTVARTFSGADMTFDSVTPTDPNNKKEQCMQQYQYTVIYRPRDDDGKAITKEERVLTPITEIFARSEKAVNNKAIQDLAGQADLDLDFVEVIVRPFTRV